MGMLDGARAIVTGGASGIGRATCRRMVAEGAAVAVFDRDAAGARAVAAEIGGHAFVVDVADAAAMAATVTTAVDRLGGCSILFNNAGIGDSSTLHEYTLERWREIVDVNLHGVYHGIRAVAPVMLAGGGGSIVNTSSISGTRPAGGEGPYSAAKAAVAALTATAALEYAPTIRVNAIAPGMIRTALTEPIVQYLPAVVDELTEKIPLGRWGVPEDVADVVVFLCSEQARYVTGQNLVIDGGLTLHGSGVDVLYRHLTALSGLEP
ncbi:MAG: SDR family NAD(P)-dependent oxidoreductase [Acidimicrobiia bacterium]